MTTVTAAGPDAAGTTSWAGPACQRIFERMAIGAARGQDWVLINRLISLWLVLDFGRDLPDDPQEVNSDA